MATMQEEKPNSLLRPSSLNDKNNMLILSNGKNNKHVYLPNSNDVLSYEESQSQKQSRSSTKSSNWYKEEYFDKIQEEDEI